MSLSWENQQQLVGDQASLDYVLSCSNRIHNANHSTGTNEELNLILTRAASITKVGGQRCVRFRVVQVRPFGFVD